MTAWSAPTPDGSGPRSSGARIAPATSAATRSRLLVSAASGGVVARNGIRTPSRIPVRARRDTAFVAIFGSVPISASGVRVTVSVRFAPVGAIAWQDTQYRS